MVGWGPISSIPRTLPGSFNADRMIVINNPTLCPSHIHELLKKGGNHLVEEVKIDAMFTDFLLDVYDQMFYRYLEVLVYGSMHLLGPCSWDTGPTKGMQHNLLPPSLALSRSPILASIKGSRAQTYVSTHYT